MSGSLSLPASHDSTDPYPLSFPSASTHAPTKSSFLVTSSCGLTLHCQAARLFGLGKAVFALVALVLILYSNRL